MPLYLTLKHLKYCLKTPKVETKCYPLKISFLFFIKKLSDQLFGNSHLPINKTLESTKSNFHN